MSLFKSKRKFACSARFLLYKDGVICAKNSPKRTSHGVARAIVKGTSLRSPSSIMGTNGTTIKKIHIFNEQSILIHVKSYPFEVISVHLCI